jgi:hypothetical protein
MGLQVDEQLPVGEAAAEPAGGVHRQRRLADTGHAVDRPDRRPGLVEGRDAVHLDPTAGEVRRVVRQEAHPTARGRGDRGRSGSVGQRRIVAKDALFQVGEGAAGIQPLLVGEHGAEPAGRGEGVVLASRPVEGEHEVGGQPLAQRVRGHVGGELVDEISVPPHGQLQFGEALDGREPPVLQPRAGRLDEVGAHVGERLPPPQRQRGAESAGGLLGLGIADAPRLGDAGSELLQVELARLGTDHVPRRPGRQHVRRSRRPQHPPEAGDRGVDLGTRGVRRGRAPDRADETLRADHGAGVQQQVGQHRPVPGRRAGQGPVLRRDLHWSQHGETHPHRPIVAGG